MGPNNPLRNNCQQPLESYPETERAADDDPSLASVIDTASAIAQSCLNLTQTEDQRTNTRTVSVSRAFRNNPPFSPILPIPYIGQYFAPPILPLSAILYPPAPAPAVLQDQEQELASEDEMEEKEIFSSQEGPSPIAQPPLPPQPLQPFKPHFAPQQFMAPQVYPNPYGMGANNLFRATPFYPQPVCYPPHQDPMMQGAAQWVWVASSDQKNFYKQVWINPATTAPPPQPLPASATQHSPDLASQHLSHSDHNRHESHHYS